MVCDAVIIGAGPAGLTAAIYLRRAGKNVLVLEKETFGGQITHSPKVENYPGFISMTGTEFADKLVEQALMQGAEIDMDEAEGIEKAEDYFIIKGQRGAYNGRSVILATGSHHRKLGLPKEDDFTGEGISYCAVCDGAFYKGKEVALIGGGNSALQEAILLSKTSKSVTVVQNLGFLTGEAQLQKQIAETDNITVILNSVVKEILGSGKFEGIKIEDTQTKEETVLPVDAAFVAIGQQPENENFKNSVVLDGNGYIIADEKCIPISDEGIFVAGDCRTKQVRQIATAIADGATAAIKACNFLG